MIKQSLPCWLRAVNAGANEPVMVILALADRPSGVRAAALRGQAVRARGLEVLAAPHRTIEASARGTMR
ncbi:hypothetical protein [uncultured Piscinibacter sp.]|uniref:hypothetical protein n=1 Tax=uncultured Piscinibacter sp. TaxID=1131835 RepID=UPI002604ED00|nr:hypothetical protein [uncultured Piscinibacter sp.]